MKLTKTLGYFGLIASILVGIGEYLLHYSPSILDASKEYDFFKSVSLDHLTLGHFIAIIGIPFYFAGYIHIYKMLKSGNELLSRIVLALGFIAFTVGGLWIGSRASIGNITHLESAMTPSVYQNLISHYTDHMEILVQVLRVVIAALSIVFAITILKGGTYYKKWMAIFNPITVLILLVVFGTSVPSLGKHFLPILMNVTHFIIFGLSLYQLNKHYNNA